MEGTQSRNADRWHPSEPPRGVPIRDVDGWRIVSCSDVRHTWVEMERVDPLASVRMTPGTARRVADALMEVATHAGDSAVKHFVERADT